MKSATEDPKVDFIYGHDYTWNLYAISLTFRGNYFNTNSIKISITKFSPSVPMLELSV